MAGAADLRPLRFTVVMPCRDAAATLGTQLEALARQRVHGDWEVLVADNGSTDASRDVAQRFAGRLPGLRVVDAAARSGPAHARNAGAAAARGAALVFCDADDEVADGFLEAMAGGIERHGFVAARFELARLNPPRFVKPHPQETGLNPYTYPPFLPHAGGAGLGVRRDLHDLVGGFDETLEALEDTDYCWRIQLAGTALVSLPEAVVHVRLPARLGATFRQMLRYGEHNVLLYTRYRGRGMPRLGPGPGLLRWARLVLTMPSLLTARRRAAWISQLGWRLGRLKGCLRYRSTAL
ncbi:MAG TPA: glycosyltransferase [Thermoanaerobaculia bacterium]|nr:glycosyltransferase [Thermoanaerobaculia bacterium]